jgi:hypothetical protein
MKSRIITPLILLFLSFAGLVQAQHSVAREWNESLLQAIRTDFARPTVHARNLFHISAAMYDAWAAYDTIAEPFLLGKTVGGYISTFNGVPTPADVTAARKKAISFAAYRMLKHRFQASPGATALFTQIDFKMAQLGYDIGIVSTNYASGDPAMLGNYIAQQYIQFGLQDGANEGGGYANQYYQPVNPPLVIKLPGNPDIVDLNRWQQLTLDVFIDQSGNVIPFNTPPFLSPEWGNVVPFSMTSDDLTIHERNGHQYKVYHDPGAPAYLDTLTGGGTSDFYKWGFELVSIWSSHLEPDDVEIWDISPASIGNMQSYPTNFTEYQQFYDLIGGGDASPGHAVNPKTGLPYEPQLVPRGDYARVLAEFWADGPNSETPPGHWFEILNYVSDHPDLVKKFRGQGPILDDLEWDVKAYFALGGAMHDVAISAWGIKGWYDYIRPVSAIRGMAELGQSSDPSLPNYHPGGLTLVPGYVEVVEAGDPLEGDSLQNIGKIKLYAWRGPDYINFPQNDVAGVDWILAENWWPYQRPSFVTPPFAGYISGHSTYSRAAAELLTALTGDPFFPGGMGEFECPQNEFLVFEDGPSQDVTLQWATYRDASDQCSLSRIWGGIHPPMDDIPGRFIGMEIGVEAFNYAESYFFKDEDGDGFYNYVDCDDNNAAIHPDAVEICDGIDNDCNGTADDGLVFFTYFFDADGDGFGDETATVESCDSAAPAGYVSNAADCNDADAAQFPGAVEVCDGIDNNCDGMVDNGLTVSTYYLDSDGDGFGDAAASVDTCATTPPAGYVANGTDCNDTSNSQNPGAAEVCDGIDNNCDGTVDNTPIFFVYYQDADGDGFGSAVMTFDTCASNPPAGFVANDVDCDDTNASVHPGAMEVLDSLDNDCNGLVDDGIVSTQSISQKPVKIFPNPSHDRVTIQYQFSGLLTAQVFRTDGTMVSSQALDFAGGQAQLRLDEMPQGVYWISASDAEGRRLFVERVVKI